MALPCSLRFDLAKPAVCEAFRLDPSDADVCHQLGVLLLQTNTALKHPAAWDMGDELVLLKVLVFCVSCSNLLNGLMSEMNFGKTFALVGEHKCNSFEFCALSESVISKGWSVNCLSSASYIQKAIQALTVPP